MTKPGVSPAIALSEVEVPILTTTYLVITKVNSLTRLSTRRKASRSADYDVRKGSVMVCDEASDEEEASVILRDDIVMAAG